MAVQKLKSLFTSSVAHQSLQFCPRALTVLTALMAALLLTACPPKSTSSPLWALFLGGGTAGFGSKSYVVGGTVSGLAGTGLKLMNNGADEIDISADGPFAFPASLSSGASFNVQVSAQPTGPSQTCTASNNTGLIAAAPVTTVTIVCSTTTFTVGGSVSGLSGSGLKLTNNGAHEISVNANGSFTFPAALADGSSYNVQVSAQPSAPVQTCSVSSNTGTLSGANITTVSVVCATSSFTIGGNVTGLAGTGLQLTNNGGDALNIAADGTFTFSASVADLSSYDVQVSYNPTAPAQTCTPASNTGTVSGANVTGITITCVTRQFTLGGSVTGLVGTGLQLTNNGGDALNISASGSFAFATSLADLSSYDVQISAQPTGPHQTCVAANNTGALAGADITIVAITCTTNTYTVGGSISGLTGSGLKLKNNGGDELSIASGATSFTFATSVADQGAYSVTVSAQPSGQNCTVTGGSPGTINAANVTGVTIACSTAYTVGGRVSGLNGTLILRNNGGDDTSVSADGTFAFPGQLANGASYAVTIYSKPAAQTCTLTNAVGTIAGASVSNVLVYCYTTGDTTKPTVVSTTPANAATGVSPLGATITVVFSEGMQVGTLPTTLTTEAYNGSWVAIPNTATFAWTTSTTLTITLSWIRFPENTQLRWTLPITNLYDTAGNQIAAQVQNTFTTGIYTLTFPVADTGQTLCYNATASQACGIASFPGQDGDYVDTPNARSFTVPTAHATYTSDYTTTDNVTGLVWATCSNGLSGATCATGTATTATWYNAINACATLNAANSGVGYAGRTKWRLPTKLELETLPNYAVTSPAIDTTAFPGTVGMPYWTASAYAPAITYAWYVSFQIGHVNGVYVTNAFNVRCVSTGY